jgi:hypothetical protein
MIYRIQGNTSPFTYVLLPAHFRQGCKVQYTVGNPRDGSIFNRAEQLQRTSISHPGCLQRTSYSLRHANVKKPPKPTTWTWLRKWARWTCRNWNLMRMCICSMCACPGPPTFSLPHYSSRYSCWTPTRSVWRARPRQNDKFME